MTSSVPSPLFAFQQAENHSGYLRRIFAASHALRDQTLEQVQQRWLREEMLTFLEACGNPTDEAHLKQQLRKLRKAVMARLIVRDVGGLACLEEVVETATTLAEVTIEYALTALKGFFAHYGTPIGEETGQTQELIVVGMGKLGGRELNVSSDIDLIFVYAEEGQTNGSRSLSNREYFTRLAKKLIQVIDEKTGDGFVFRVDMRLRPYGESGPLVSNLASLEEYLLTQGRAWERYAWIKGRVLVGDETLLMPVVRPFVFRKYLDYGAYGSMRELHAQIRREVARKDRADNIKLGPGGIREIEFIAQVFQLIRGGRVRELQIKPTCEVLTRLAELGLLPQETVEGLLKAYRFLRDLEHRLQYLEDEQTQMLPIQPEAQVLIATSMGFETYADFLAVLTPLRAEVSTAFETIFSTDQEEKPAHPLTALWEGIASYPEAETVLMQLGYEDAPHVLQALRALAESAKYQQLPEKNRQHFDALMPTLIEIAGHQKHPDATLLRMLKLMETVGRRAAYLAMMVEQPKIIAHLASLYGASPWVAQYLTQHPILMDELLDPRILYAEPNWERAHTLLAEELDHHAGDTEQEMEILRHTQHSRLFRLVAQDLGGKLTLEHLSDHLSALADMIVAETFRRCWAELPRKHTETPCFAIIGYGKLGGKELGYASDLDLIYLFDDPHPDAQEVYARLVRRMVNWLTTMTPSGILYDIDLRLRPNGASGLLVSSVEAFQTYQAKSAWVWEHQALTRARFVAGDASIGVQFEQIRHDVLAQARVLSSLKEEVVSMRLKMLETHPSNEAKPDIKHLRGGIVDVEFIVQYLILAYAHQHPELTANHGNIALLGRMGEAGLISKQSAEAAQTAYRLYRRIQHAKRLDETLVLDITPELRTSLEAIQQLWGEVFES